MEKSHQKILDGISNQFKLILNTSEQGMYIYLDDIHKMCNKNFSAMLGYTSPDEWAQIKGSFPKMFVSTESQMNLVENFRNAIEKGNSSKIQITWKKKNGEKVNSSVIMVPISYDGHRMALHFITPVSQ